MSSNRFWPRPSRLWLKLVLSLIAVVLVSSVLMVLLVRLSLNRGIRQMLSSSDRVWAEEIADAASRYLAQGGSLEEFALSIGTVPRNRTYTRRWPERTAILSGPMGAMMRRAMNSPPLGITDQDGRLLFHAIDEGVPRDFPLLAVRDGSPIVFQNQIVAYVFAGSLLQPGLGPLQAEFLARVNRAAVWSGLLGLLVAVSLGSALFAGIMSPLRALLAAIGRVSAGTFDIQLDEHRSDDFGIINAGFARMTRTLAEADAWKRRLIVDAAHELRTPVSLIQTRLELMLDGVYPMERSQVEALYANTRLMSQLLQDLQELSAAEAGTARLEFRPVRLEDLLRETADNFQAPAALRRITVAVHLVDPVSDPVVNADRQALARILNNLVGNALKAVGERGLIELQLREGSRGTIDLCCVDNGPGIPEPERERIFERFYRLDAARTRDEGGSGLGLAISRELARLHGGSLVAEAGPGGKGALFRLSLPRRLAHGTDSTILVP